MRQLLVGVGESPTELAAAVTALETKGLCMDRIASMRDSFWSASMHHPTKLAAAVAAWGAKGLCMDRIASMGDSFWSVSVNHPTKLADAVVALEAGALHGPDRVNG